eukprot:6177610-Pleurochrysis_carterae.AAC.2
MRHVLGVPLGQKPGDKKITQILHFNSRREWEQFRSFFRKDLFCRWQLREQLLEALAQICAAALLGLQQPADPTVAIGFQVLIGSDPQLEFALKCTKLLLHFTRDVATCSDHVSAQRLGYSSNQSTHPLHVERGQTRERAIY